MVSSVEDFDYIIIENGAGLAYKLSQRGYKNLILHMHNEVRKERSEYHKAVFGSFTKILTVSDYIKRKAAEYYPIEKIQTVHNGIDLKNFYRKEKPTVSRQDLGFTSDDFIMVYSGRINKEKGVSELIEAMLQLTEYPHIKLMIIGGTFFGNTGNEDDFVRSLKVKARPIEEKIIFTGFLSYDKMPDYLQLADTAVIPSVWNDPFPTTELEAQAMGLPIITTVQGGIPEEVSVDNAILLETDSQLTDHLAAAILELYHHPEKRSRMGAVSLERSKYFNKERFAQDFFAAIGY